MYFYEAVLTEFYGFPPRKRRRRNSDGGSSDSDCSNGAERFHTPSSGSDNASDNCVRSVEVWTIENALSSLSDKPCLSFVFKDDPSLPTGLSFRMLLSFNGSRRCKDASLELAARYDSARFLDTIWRCWASATVELLKESVLPTSAMECVNTDFAASSATQCSSANSLGNDVPEFVDHDHYYNFLIGAADDGKIADMKDSVETDRQFIVLETIKLGPSQFSNSRSHHEVVFPRSLLHSALKSDGSLRMRLKLTVYNIDRAIWSREFLRGLHRSGISSDFTIKVGAEQFAAHKCVLAAESDVLKTLFLDGGGDVLDLTNITGPNGIKAFLALIYCDEFDWPANLAAIPDILMLAYRFKVEHVRCQIVAIIRKLVGANNVLRIFEVALECSATRAIDACFSFLLTNRPALKSSECLANFLQESPKNDRLRCEFLRLFFKGDYCQYLFKAHSSGAAGSQLKNKPIIPVDDTLFTDVWVIEDAENQLKEELPTLQHTLLVAQQSGVGLEFRLKFQPKGRTKTLRRKGFASFSLSLCLGRKEYKHCLAYVSVSLIEGDVSIYAVRERLVEFPQAAVELDRAWTTGLVGKAVDDEKRLRVKIELRIVNVRGLLKCHELLQCVYRYADDVEKEKLAAIADLAVTPDDVMKHVQTLAAYGQQLINLSGQNAEMKMHDVVEKLKAMVEFKDPERLVQKVRDIVAQLESFVSDADLKALRPKSLAHERLSDHLTVGCSQANETWIIKNATAFLSNPTSPTLNYEFQFREPSHPTPCWSVSLTLASDVQRPSSLVLSAKLLHGVRWASVDFELLRLKKVTDSDQGTCTQLELVDTGTLGPCEISNCTSQSSDANCRAWPTRILQTAVNEDDTLHIRVGLKIHDVNKAIISRDLIRGLRQREASFDFTIKSGSGQFGLHKSVLAAYCRVDKSALEHKDSFELAVPVKSSSVKAFRSMLYCDAYAWEADEDVTSTMIDLLTLAHELKADRIEDELVPLVLKKVLCPKNALRFYDAAVACSATALTEATLDFILEKRETIAKNSEFLENLLQNSPEKNLVRCELVKRIFSYPSNDRGCVCKCAQLGCYREPGKNDRSAPLPFSEVKASDSWTIENAAADLQSQKLTHEFVFRTRPSDHRLELKLRLYPKGRSKQAQFDAFASLSLGVSGILLSGNEYWKAFLTISLEKESGGSVPAVDADGQSRILVEFTPSRGLKIDKAWPIKSLQSAIRGDNTVVIKVELEFLDVRESLICYEIVRQLGDQKQFCDFTSRAHGKTIEVHKCVLAQRSEVFANMLSSEMRESTDSFLDLTESTTSAESLNEFLSAVYFGDIDFKDGETAVEIMKLADQYGVNDIKGSCDRYFARKIDMENVLEVLYLCQTYGLPQSNASCMRFLRANCIEFLQSSAWKELSANDQMKEVLLAITRELLLDSSGIKHRR